MATQIQLRRDLAGNWASENPLLASGEAGVEFSSGDITKLKIGDGLTPWEDIPYFLPVDDEVVSENTTWSSAKIDSNAADAQTIVYDNVSSGLTADNVQDAIDELDGILDTVPKSAADVKSMYESNPDTNAFTDEEKDKLASLEGSHWRGTFVSLLALQTDVTDPLPGDYADVDAGVGQEIQRYIWDDDDSQWVAQSGTVPALTAAQVKTLYESNPDTNAYTDTEKSKLTGIESGAEVNEVNEAPEDGESYVRKDGTWEALQAPVTPSAEDISYDNLTSGLTAIDVQGAIDEVSGALVNYIPVVQKGTAFGVATLDPNGKVPASQLQAEFVPVTDTGNYYASSDVEGSLQEIGLSIVNINNLIGDIEEALDIINGEII